MLNKTSFAYQAGILAISNTMLLLLGFVYRILIGRLAGPEGMGVYTLVIQVYTILMSVCVYGMCVAVTHMATGLGEDDRGIRKLMRFANIWFLVLYALLALPVLLFREQIAAGLLGDPRTARALLMILLCVLLTGLENVLKAVFTGLRLVKYTAISEVGEQLLRIVLAAALLVTFINADHGRTAFLILCAMTLSELYSVGFLFISYVRSIRRMKKKRAPGENMQIRRHFTRLALPSTGTSILGNVFASVTVLLFPMRLLLAGYTRAEAVSALGLISGMAMPVLTLPAALINAVCTLLMPSIADCVARHRTKELHGKINKGIEVVGLIGIPATALLLPFAPMLCAMLFGETAPFLLFAALALEAAVTYYLFVISSVLNGLGGKGRCLCSPPAAKQCSLRLCSCLQPCRACMYTGMYLVCSAAIFCTQGVDFFAYTAPPALAPACFMRRWCRPLAASCCFYLQGCAFFC